MATLTQVLVDPTSTLPSLRASGAIAAVMGAFLATYPSDRIRTAIILGWSVKVTFLPAVAMVGLWFGAQVFSEVGGFIHLQTDAGVLYLAHVGGLVYGSLTCRLFETRRRGRLQRLEAESPQERYEY